MRDWRLVLLIFFIVLVSLALIFRLFSLQISKHQFYKGLAESQHQIYEILFPVRGEIFAKDRYGDISSLAVNKEGQMVYAVPKDIKNKEEVVGLLSPLLGIDEGIIRTRISKHGDPYEPLKHRVSEELANQIGELNLKGIKLAKETWRYFPVDSLAAHVLGFLGFRGDKPTGQYGLEGYYNEKLEGETGFIETEKDTRGYWILAGKRNLQPAKDGFDLILTIDPNVQFVAEERLKEAVERWDAEGGTVIVLNPETGAVKAMANFPSFNLNEYWEVEDINVFLNPAIHKLFEPGSIFKPITMAAALDKGLISPKTSYEDRGFVKIGIHTINNVQEEPQGIQTMTQVLEKSLNTGAVFVQNLMGKEIFKEYIEKFDFDDPTGIDLEGEIGGNTVNLKKGDIEYANMSFGQGIAITPIQLIRTLAVIANEGKLMRPYIVEKLVRADGVEQAVKPEVVRQVISPDTAYRLTAMMVSVVENGYGKPAQIPGYWIAGKTGTAQVPSPDKKGYSDKTIHSFIGFAPAFNPEFVILIKLDNPKGIRFAADSVSPVFKEIAEYILNYYEIAPSR